MIDNSKTSITKRVFKEEKIYQQTDDQDKNNNKNLIDLDKLNGDDFDVSIKKKPKPV